jgi:hypothetical protein
MPTTTKTPESTTGPSSPKKLPHRTYTVRGQKRALFTLGTGEHSKLMDVPFALLDIAASGQPTADSYLVEEGLRPRDPTGELQALLADYLATAERHQAVPMTVCAISGAVLEARAA